MSNVRHGPHQTRDWPPPAYEIKLARTLEEIYGGGVHDLPGVVDSLNRTQLKAPGGAEWTAETFVSTMRELGE